MVQLGSFVDSETHSAWLAGALLQEGYNRQDQGTESVPHRSSPHLVALCAAQRNFVEALAGPHFLLLCDVPAR